MTFETKKYPGSSYVYYYLIDDDGKTVCVAVVTNKVARIPRPLYSMFPKRHAWYISIVESYVKRKGYATMLLKHVLEEKKGKDVYLIAQPLRNYGANLEALIKFYSSLGFKCIDGDIDWGQIMLKSK